MSSSSANNLPSLDSLQDDFAFNAVLIESLDPHDDEYPQRLAELNAETARLEGLIELHTSGSNQRNQHDMNMNGAFANSDGRDSWWQNAMDGRPGSNSSSESMNSEIFGQSSASRHFHPNGIKRGRPESSYLSNSFEHVSKRPTPDPSNAGTPRSTGSPFELGDQTDAARRRQQMAETAARRQQEAFQQLTASQRDAAFAREMGQPRPSQALASSSRPGVQTTLNYNGGFQKPLGMIRPEPPSSRQPSQFTPSFAMPQQYQVKAEPSFSRTQHLPNFSSPDHHRIKAEPSASRPQQLPHRPRQPTSVIDLTGSDDDDDFAEIAPARFTPNPSRAARPSLPSTHTASNVPQFHVPGSFPQNNSQYVYGNQASAANTGMASNVGAWNRAHAGINAGMNGVSRILGEVNHLMFGSSSSNPLELDDEDDGPYDSFAGHRQLPGYGNYAGQEDLYNQRYNDLAAYDSSKSREELEALLANIRPDEDMPAHLRVQTPEDMSVNLHKYQELGLTWLKNQEESPNMGGILADDMGLGKTIQMLSLMVTRKSEDPRCKTTLIIAPVALMRQWKAEIRNKLKPGKYQLTVFTHHGTTKAKDFNDLRTFDVVLTTYGTIAAELKRLEKFKLRQMANAGVTLHPTASEKTVFLAPNAKWYRVILDEAQCIKNRTTQTSKGACALNAKYRFCVTGTPMMNNVEEFYSLIQFLRIKPYCQWQRFRLDFNTPLRSSSDQVRQQAMQKLQILCRSIMLRRTKKSTFEGKPILVLPERTTDEVNPVFSEDETDFYKALETQSQITFNKYLRAGTVGQSYSAILVLLLRLRQACCHPHLIKDFGVAAAADMSEDQMLEFAKELAGPVVERIKATGGNFECPVCYDVTANPAIFVPCGHDTCSECFTKIADPAMAIQNGDERGQARCPNCRGNIDPKRLTDFNSFKKVHMPELLSAEEQAAMGEIEADSDTDSDEESDSESDEEEDDEDETLDGFVVPDDEEVEQEEETDSDDLDRTPVKIKKRVVDDDEDSDSDDLDTKPSKVKDEVKEESLEGVAGPSTVPEYGGDKKSDIKEAKGKGKAKKKGKGKQKEKKKKVKSTVTLAELKKQASRNKTAKKKYLKRLRKDWVTSAKIEKTMEILSKIMNDKEGEKVLIFSQWTSLLDLIEIPIDELDYGYRRYDGSMTAAMRGDAVDDFTSPQKNIRIMLVSLKAGNAGLNLNMASQVIILDPFWNPYIEEQAIDRAHRIGQKRPVKVHKVLIKDTVEDRIAELQEKKRRLISEALDEQQSQQLGRLGVRELAYLFGATADPSQNIAYQPRQRQR